MQSQVNPETASPFDDQRLLATFVASGSQEAFATLVERHSPLVFGVCRRMLGDADAHDATQAVFVLLWQKAKRLTGDAIVAGWLYQTAHHVCRNAIRSRASRINHEQQAAAELPTMSPDSHGLVQWNEVRTVLDEEVSRLPENLRTSFILFHLEHRSLAEVAAILGSSVSTVGSWLQRSRERLAVRLRQRGIAVGAAALAALLAQYAVAEVMPATFVATTVRTATGFASGGVAGTSGAAAISHFVRLGAGASVARQGWTIAGIFATLIGFPIVFLWLLPALQTRQSADFTLLQGEWREVAHEQGGGPVNVQPRVEYVGSLIVSGRRFRRFQTLASGQVLGNDHGTFVLDDAHEPKAIDFTFWTASIQGIYRFEGDTLTLCISQDGEARPGDFTTAPNDNRILTKYQRVE